MRHAKIGKPAKVTVEYDNEVWVINPTCINVQKTVTPWDTIIHIVTFEWTGEPVVKTKAKKRKKL